MNDNLSSPVKSTSAGAISAALTTAVGYLAGLGWDLSSVDWSLAFNWLIGLGFFGGVVGNVTSDKKSKAKVYAENIGKAEDKRPRGIRNNNPGNVEFNANIDWMGQIGKDSRFVKFSEPVYGIRAMARNLKNQKRIHNLNTIRSMLYKYAPNNENDTEQYIAFVESKTAIDANAIVDFENDLILLPLMRAMIKMENGQNPYSDELIRTGIGMA